MAAFQFGGLVQQVSSVVAAAGTTTLTNTSKQIQILTVSGGNGQTYVLPSATTMVVGQQFLFFNTSAGTLTLNTNGGALLQTIAPGSSAYVFLLTNGAAAGTWAVQPNLAFSTAGNATFAGTAVPASTYAIGGTQDLGSSSLLWGNLYFGHQILHTGVQPTVVATTPATAADRFFDINGTAAQGGNTTIATTGVGGLGAGSRVVAGAGGSATSATTSATGGAGGAHVWSGGAGATTAVTSATASIGGGGGAVQYTGGVGGNGSSTTGTNQGGTGGNGLLTSGAGGLANGAGSGANTSGNGGLARLLGGAGGAASGSTSSNVGGVGGASTLQGGVGGAVSGSATSSGAGNGGGVNIVPGSGGASTSSTGANTGGQGGTITLSGSAGGAASGAATTNTGGTGSAVAISAGVGGIATNATTNNQGPGGIVTISGGAAGASGTGAGGGSVQLQGGAATGDGTVRRDGGLISLRPGASVGATGDTLVYIQGTVGWAATATTGTNAGGPGSRIKLEGGTGGSATGVGATQNTGGDGPNYLFNSDGAVGGLASGATTNIGGTGGRLQYASATGGAATGGTTATGGTGGFTSLISGDGGAATSGTTSTGGAGGSMTLRAGAGGSASAGTTNIGGAGGQVSIQGGSSGSGGTGAIGGQIYLLGGNASGNGAANRDGGYVYLQPGAAVGNGATSYIDFIGSSGWANTAVGTSGNGSKVILNPGNGGAATVVGTGTNRGGDGGPMYSDGFTVGAGGNASGGTVANFGGKGSSVQWSTGNGGNASGTGAVGGNGGDFQINTGAGGTGTTPGSVGSIYFLQNNVTRAVIDSAGNFNYSSPNNGGLLINGSAGNPTIRLTSFQAAGGSTQPIIQLNRLSAANGPTPGSSTVGDLRFDGLDTASSYAYFAGISATLEGANASGGAAASMLFYTSASGASATERMRINSAGFVGIGGAVTPSFLLDLNFNTSATSAAATNFRMFQSGAGDTNIRWATPAQAWNIGIDQSDSNKFKIGGTVWDSTDTVVTIDTSKGFALAGTLGVGGPADPGTAIWVRNSTLTGTGQAGVYWNGTFNSAATVLGYGFLSQGGTAAASFTLPDYGGVVVANPSKGAGSTITRNAGVDVQDQTSGTTNYGFRSRVTSGANKFSIYSDGTADSVFAGNVRIGSTSVPVATLDVTGNVALTGNVAVVASTNPYLVLTTTSGGTKQAFVQVSTGDLNLTPPTGGIVSISSGAVTQSARLATTGAACYLGFTDTATSSITRVQIGSSGNSFQINMNGNVALTADTGGNVTTSFGVATNSFDTSSPATGGTVTASANKPGVMITPAGTIATCTIKLPSSPIDGQQYWVASSQQITAVTWQDAGGTAGNVVGGPATIGGTNRGARFIYSTTLTKWYNIG